MSDLSKIIAELTPEQLEILRMQLGKLGTQVEDPSRAPIKRQSRESNAFPLSFGQHRLWFIEQLRPGNLAYNISSAVRLSGRLDPLALERALDEIVRRHEALRTTFAARDDLPVQIVMPHRKLKMEVLDLAGADRETHEVEAKRLALAEAQRPFDLATGPLFRVALLRFDEEEHIMLRSTHHIVFDHLSQEIFVYELVTLYRAFAAGKPSPLTELPIQYADYAVWQREWLQGEVLDKQLDYWKQKLSGAPRELLLPFDRPRPRVQSFHGAPYSFEIPEELAAQLETLSRKENATLFITLLAAFKLLLYKYTAQEDLVIGTTLSGRHRVEFENLIGFFANTLVLRTDVSGDPTFGELINRVREVLLGAEAHQFVPFEKIVEELQIERDVSRQTLFQVLFNLQTTRADALQLPGLEISLIETSDSASKFDLTIFLTRTPRGISSTFVYNTDLFNASTVARMAQDYCALLRLGAARVEGRMRELLQSLSEEYQHRDATERVELKKSNLERLKNIRRKPTLS
jgi:aspartate racemase